MAEKLISQGHFQLDSRRAMEKLAKYQLEDPHRYVLELIAAAISAGSTRIDVRNDSDDLEIGWDGLHPSEEELEDLFSSIFESSSDPRRRMLKHLAQGIFGASGLQPRWIRLERPGLFVDFTNLRSPNSRPSERTKGVFVHVRERFGWKVLQEAINPFDEAYESRLIRSNAQFAPVPVWLGKEMLERPQAPVHAWELLKGKVWLEKAVKTKTMKGKAVEDWIRKTKAAMTPKMKPIVISGMAWLVPARSFS